MADYEARDFKATGPTSENGFEAAGDVLKITCGVKATGQKYGVHGITSRLPDEPEGQDNKDRVGVFGEGVGDNGSVGVKGLCVESSNGTGVQGIGTGTGVGGSGILGVKGQGFPDHRSPDAPVAGVWGESHDGTGVHGVSDNGTGVVGISGHVSDDKYIKHIFATGVYGHCEGGWGVHGLSTSSYGGVFESNFAQVRLVPASSVGEPKANQHYRGELFVDATGSLFYCVDGGTPGIWRELAPRLTVFERFRNSLRSLVERF